MKGFLPKTQRVLGTASGDTSPIIVLIPFRVGFGFRNFRFRVSGLVI